ncbi:septum-promoting GTP-binding protein 1-like [Aristolochia californica]|uniref:septum-promoting GTP-binding protein 1-like n=1 Tax=Aristolochia californica TaxID=171875 RepID=UPI0035DB4CAB
MTHICRKVVDVNVTGLVGRVAIFRRIFRFLWERILLCSSGKPHQYRRLPPVKSSLPEQTAAVPDKGEEAPGVPESTRLDVDLDGDSDMVVLKISLLGDCQIGKTSFMTKYVGNDEKQNYLQMAGLTLMDKVFPVRGTKIAFNIWDVGGDQSFHVPIACKDAAAILIMFDLTSRCTLNSCVEWYRQARKWNQTAIPVLIGTKFDDFVQLPVHLQWAIMTQARVYARAMNAALFFSSATHNINVNKIFKFITAELFNLPLTVQRNLTIGEPIIDY